MRDDDMPRVLGITQSRFDPASRFRFIQFIPGLEEAGWGVDHRACRPDRQWKSGFENRYARGVHYRAGRLLMKLNRWRDLQGVDAYDAVFVNRDLAGPAFFLNGRRRGPSMALEKALVRRNPRLVYDFDDAIYLGDPAEEKTAWMCRHAAWVTPGNEYLAGFARRHTSNVTVIPTVVDTDVYRSRPPERADGDPIRVGWSGSDNSVRANLFPFLAVLREAQRAVDFELVVITNTKPDLPADGLRWSFVPWRPEDEGRLWEHFDVGIMPLDDAVQERGKCGLKLLQYMAAGLPNISSPVGVNRDIVLEGRTGFLAATPADWARTLGELARSRDLRRSMGEASRERCERHYSVRRWLPELVRIFERVSGAAVGAPAARA